MKSPETRASRAAREPIAIVGIGCRLPGGVETPEQLYRLCFEGRSGIVDVPADRWDADALYHPDYRKAGRIHVKRGGFIDNVAGFDCSFFGITPNEARRIDPQQRVVLEAAFRAFEDAGMRLDEVAGSNTAVMVGASGRDYGEMTTMTSERRRLGATTNTGGASSIIANRVSYVFDLRGGSMTVDTACSSTLYAVHYACQSIWSGSADMALAGGVNLILKPETTIGFSTGGYLSPDGECRAFSADANGYVRSEGVGMLLLKPLSRAQADGNRIYALIRGSFVNQDGKSMSMTVPSVEAQIDLLARAFRDAQVEPSAVHFVEAHGTGTAVGNPIEARAIGAVLGRGRPQGTCYIGSVKTNVGHLESGAGAAALIKLALTLKHRVVPPNRNFNTPNPSIPFDELRLTVPTAPVALPANGPLFGGVNGFGFGGANAHLVLESPPVESQGPSERDLKGAFVLRASARTATALAQAARAAADWIAESSSDDEAAEKGDALAQRRSAFELRVAHVARDAQSAAAGLRAFASDTATPHVYVGRVPSLESEKGEVAFIYTGQGPQWWGMGRSLMGASRVFRDTVECVDEQLRKLGWLASEQSGLRVELARDEATSRMGETQIAQPAIFALQVGLTAVLKERGFVPSAVTGHSIGELAAAVAAGAITLEQGTRIAYWRSRSQASAEGKGAMAAVGLSADAIQPWLRPRALELAAVNGPRTVTVAGTHEAVAELHRELDAKDIFCRVLNVSVPFHCFMMDPIEQEFREGLGRLDAGAGTLPFYSTVTGGLLDGKALDEDYWYRNIRQPVLFQQAFVAMMQAGHKRFAEVGAHPALKRSADEAAQHENARGVLVVPTLKRDADDATSLMHCEAALFVDGARQHFSPRSFAMSPAALPSYAFERSEQWFETARARRERLGERAHPIVGPIERNAKIPDVFRCNLRIDHTVERFIADHRIQELIVYPGAGQLEAVAAAARQVFGGDAFLENVRFLRPMVLPDSGEPPEFRLEVYSDEGHFEISSRPAEGGEWTLHTTGRINHSGDRFTLALPRLDTSAAGVSRVAVERFFETAAETGLALGPSFRGMREFWVDGQSCASTIGNYEGLQFDSQEYLLHPTLLDAVLQTGAFCYISKSEKPEYTGLYLPSEVRRIAIFGHSEELECWAVTREASDDRIVLDLTAVAPDGRLLVQIEGLILKYIKGTRQVPTLGNDAYVWDWVPRPPVAAPALRGQAERVWIVLEDGGEAGKRVVASLRERGYSVRTSIDELARLRPSESVEGVVCFAGTASGPSLEAMERAVDHGLVPWATLVTALAEVAGRRAFWLVTRGAFAVKEGDSIDPVASLAWGFGRVVSNEASHLRTTLVNLGRPEDGDESQALCQLLVEDEPQDYELALRGSERFAHQLKRAKDPDPSAKIAVDVALTPLRAVVGTPGVLSSVTWRTEQLPEPGANQVRMEVRATGLNFKDAVVALDLLPLDAWYSGERDSQLGMDCAGVVTAVGPGVTDWSVGDEIVTCTIKGLANTVLADTRLSAPKPTSLSFAEAAALPMVFYTAEIAFGPVAHLQAGETVLIHGAAGGVGSAAIQVAHRLGARVIATTSSDEKRAWVRELGVETIFDSRSTEFRQQVLAATGGRGVDVVLNCLSGRALTQSIRCLAPYGRFVEIGKTDIYGQRQILLEPLGDNRSYHCFDLNRWLGEPHPLMSKIIHEIVARVGSGEYRKLPFRSFSAHELAESLQWVSRGRQIGKVVVEIPAHGTLEAEPHPGQAIKRNAAYLVTGGTSGLGLAVALRFAEHGAGKLVLLSRSGNRSEEARAAVQKMRDLGSEVEVWPGDVANADAVARLVQALASDGNRPLRGVVHSAMVLDDGPLAQLDRERFARVVAPKAHGAWNLHEASKHLPLDFFVMFSSVSAVFGTPGQANYAAANAFLDGLAHYRRSQGLTATALNWGVLDTGVVARMDAQTRRKVLSQGAAAYKESEALMLLEEALVRKPTERTVARFEWQRLAQTVSTRPSRFGDLASSTKQRSASDERSARQQLLELAPAERPAVIVELLKQMLSKLSGQEVATLDTHTSLSRVGLDSLMGTQLRAFVSASFGVDLALVKLLRGPTLCELAEEIASKIASQAADAAPHDEFSWVHRLSEPRSKGPALRLFCFAPFAAHWQIYHAWSSALDARVELWAIDLPDFTGPMAATLDDPGKDLFPQLTRALLALSDRPFALYGHSMGGALALQAASELHRQGKPPLFVMTGALPTDEVLRLAVHKARTPADITDELIGEVARQFGIPSHLLDDPAARASLFPLARRDIWLGAWKRQQTPSGKLAILDAPVPLSMVRGSEDRIPLASASDVSVPASVHIETHTVRGSHLFIDENVGRQQTVDLINRSFNRWASDSDS